MASGPAPFWRSVLHFESSKVEPWLALRNAVGVALPLAIGMAAGHATAGLIAASGALNVAFSDGSDPYHHRARRMLSASFFCALAVMAGGLVGQHPALTLLLTTACALAAGMMVAMGTAATDIANVTLVVLIVYSAQSMTAQQAAGSGLAALCGGLLQTALALALWPFRRHGPERRALADLYRELARSTGRGPQVMEAPPASAQATQAQTVLAASAWDRSLDAERYRALLSQAERIRLAILTLLRLRVRIGREDQAGPYTALLDRALEIAGRILTAIAESLLERASLFEGVDELRGLAESLRQSCSADPLRSLLRDARRQLDALAGQLASAWELAAHTTAVGSLLFDRREAAHPRVLRIEATLEILRADLNLRSAVFRHALRLSACVAVAEVLAHSVGWQRTYWMPMTAAIVLRPDFTTTFNRGVLRVAGTLIGLVLATALFHVLAPAGGSAVALVALFTFLLRSLGPANYGIFATTLTALVVLLVTLTGVPPGPVIAARGLNTLVGGVLALAAYQVWPTWEQTLAPEALARMLDAYRTYFQTLCRAYIDPGRSFAAELDRARQAGRLARSNAEASAARLATEPGVPPRRIAEVNTVLANSHRFIHAAMSLEAGLAHSPAAPARPEFRTFAHHADLTLYYLAAVLRGSQVSLEDLPDLREDYHALVHAGDPLHERYALVNVEADRIANTLNTLAREVMGPVMARLDPTRARCHIGARCGGWPSFWLRPPPSFGCPGGR